MAHGGERKRGTRGKRGGRNEREAWRVGRGVWREAGWAWWPGEAGRRGRAGNERKGGRREMDKVRANGRNLKEGRTTVKVGVPREHSMEKNKKGEAASQRTKKMN